MSNKMGHVINIDSNALAFIKERGGTTTVHLSTRQECCGGSASVAVAHACHPVNPQHFHCYNQDNVTIYISPELTNENLRLGIDGWWKLRRLYIDGAPIKA
ncbi:CC/Se motif family (seleno)protein [Vreelandella neptunia]|uniref:FeS cluster biogenesis domain-containing protein n=1 Tax=Vreelandella neptunia TaxID=115551 RepID=A0ABS9S7J3_9GAMM|nr:hypothetical protein [Halomonas neptunia]